MVLLLAGMAFETGLGLLVLVVAAMTALVVVALRVPGSSAFGLVVMVASLVVGVAAFGYTWWAFGVGFDAADAGRPVPAWTGHLGAAVITMAGCAATFLVAAIVAVRRGTTTP